jgi:hypothetical protein
MKKHPTPPTRAHPLRWLILLTLPILLVLGIPAAIAVKTGELFHIDHIAKAQSLPEPILFGPAYGSPDAAYKLRRTLLEKPQVLIVGSSRVLNIRREFIHPDLTFYNAGRISEPIWSIRQALIQIPKNQLPTHIILGIDQYQFNANACDDTPNTITPAKIQQRFSPSPDGWTRLPQIAPLILSDLLAGKIHPTPPPQAGLPLGIAATINSSGFRNDGSYRYGDVISTPPHQRSAPNRIADSLKRIRKNGRSFEHGQTLHQPNIDEIARLIAFCKKHNIHLIPYLPPYAPTTLAAMRSDPNKYAYLPLLHPTLNPLFTQAGLTLHDFTQAPNSTDDQFIDGFHPSERIDAQILLQIITQDPQAAKIIDSPKIQSLLKTSQDPLVLLKN